MPPHIRLIAKLGAGSMATVWSAHHRDLGEVAVKLLDPALIAEHPELEQRLRFEAEAVWRIESPHVTVVHERGVAAGGCHYIVMERLEGETLEARVERASESTLLSVSECLWILEQIAWALEAAHAQGIVHRDLKPENIFLCGREQVPLVKLLDFGIAKGSTDGDVHLTRPGALLGTPYYMSREQLLCSADVDHRADLWAFAVLAYELLTGCVPFHGKNLGYLIRSVFEGQFEPVARLRSPAIDAWFERAFDLEIEARFQSVGEMVSALREALPKRLDAEVSGIRQIVRAEEHGKTACWHPETPATEAPDVSQPEPSPALANAHRDGPRRAELPVARLALGAAALGALLGAVATLL